MTCDRLTRLSFFSCLSNRQRRDKFSDHRKILISNPSAPILLFDSGVGGLSVYDALREILPNAPVIYAADLEGLPYGTKSEAEIATRVAGLLGRMGERYQPRLACIACNTASTIALGMVREVLKIPVVGTVPAIKPAAELTQTGAIGLIGTEATIRQVYVDDLEARFANGNHLIRIAAPSLVQCAEAKLRGQEFDRTAITDTISAMLTMPGGDAIDTLVLACTHFPLLSDEIREAFGRDVQLIDGSVGIARRIVHLVEGQEIEQNGPARFVVTGPVDAARGLEQALSKRGFATPESF